MRARAAARSAPAPADAGKFPAASMIAGVPAGRLGFELKAVNHFAAFRRRHSLSNLVRLAVALLALGAFNILVAPRSCSIKATAARRWSSSVRPTVCGRRKTDQSFPATLPPTEKSSVDDKVATRSK
jgi:hypothetical protein